MKTRTVALLSLGFVAITLTALIHDYRTKRPHNTTAPTTTAPSIPRPAALTSKDMVMRARTMAKSAVDLDGFKPAIIYSQIKGTSEESYACIGSVRIFNGKPKLFTASHLFYLSGERSYRVEILNQQNAQPLYLQGPGIEVSDPQKDGGDRVMGYLGPEPHFFRNQGRPEWVEEVNFSWDIPTIEGVTVDRVTGGISGKVFTSVGWVLNPKTKAHYLTIETVGLGPGDSGTLFMDGAKRFWILHAGPDTGEMEQQMIQSYHAEHGRILKGVSMLSGPFIIQ